MEFRKVVFVIIVVVALAYVVHACNIVVGFFMNTISSGSCLNDGMKYWLYL